jgi:hypothetical protein
MIATDEIKKLWKIIAVSDSSILELRAIWPAGITPSRPPITKHFRAKAYSSVDACKAAFEVEAMHLNDVGYNIYFMMNPIASSFNGSAAKDGDISHRNLLLIDIDRAEMKKEPATDAEVEAAGLLAEIVMAHLDHLGVGWPDPIRVMSGNGHHLYYALPDTPNDEDAKLIVQSLLKGLSAKFDNETVKIDTSVFNASRITKVVGTIARKGIESEGRPYRMARVL